LDELSDDDDDDENSDDDDVHPRAHLYVNEPVINPMYSADADEVL